MVTFRARRRHWVFTIVGTVLVAALLVIVPALHWQGVFKYVGLVFGSLMAAWIIWKDWRPIWRAFLSIDNEKLSARVGKSLIVVHLKEIVAAMTFRDSKGQLCLSDNRSRHVQYPTAVPECRVDLADFAQSS
jgi:hypothetical protein